jgi:hypothetical protein
VKVGDLVQIKHNEHKGVFVVLSMSQSLLLLDIQIWAVIFSLKKGEEYVEMARSLEVINENR